ncbi:MAG: WXG100 family type VII secretion target [Ardenticatenaceae bacterium]|nr:WXG100 family type VII secretion target [Ardenticatenaceae bacterium]
MDTMQVDYDALEEINGRFRYQADDIFALLQRLRQMVHDLQKEGWIGLGSQAFYAEMEHVVLPAVQRLAESLDDAGMTVHQIQELFELSEEAASRTIQTGQ